MFSFLNSAVLRVDSRYFSLLAIRHSLSAPLAADRAADRAAARSEVFEEGR